MTQQKNKGVCDIGLVGLGVMGRNFALNIADQGFTVAGFNRDPVKIEALEKTKAERHAIHTTDSIPALCDLLQRPRSIMMLVPAGQPVDDVIETLLPHLEAGDLIIDSGNSHFTDTDRRAKFLAQKDILFMGMGMSGGAEGARRGPSLMPGGPRQGYERVKSILESTAAQTGRKACVDYLGPGSAGHYVKMVHNGIEYGLMELIAESYDLLKRGLGMHPDALHQVYHRWNQGELNSYLMSITADIFLQPDDHTGTPLIDLILDEAKQKGTGEWTVADALQVQVPVPNIDTAVMMRHMSGNLQTREAAAQILQGPTATLTENRQQVLDQLESALHAAFIITYAQGMDLLGQASRKYGYELNLETVARVWTGGCIIRASLLEDIQAAYRVEPGLANLMLAASFSGTLQARQADLRSVVRTAAAAGLPTPGLMAALAYLDAYRSSRLPANLIMAQRDYFGSHTYERTDRQGTFHTEWRHQS